MFVVIAYDIVSDWRRNKLVKVLKDYGKRINYSVFECEMKKEEFSELKRRVEKIINKRKDSVLYYTLCRSCIERTEYVGIKRPDELENIINI
jgi:CRISPR-associated protein Cas2